MYKTNKCDAIGQKAHCGCLGPRVNDRGVGISYKDHMETCGDDRYVHHLNRGDVFKGV